MKRIFEDWDIIVLLLGIFYCVPLTSASFGGINSDFRLYDFVILFFVIKNYKHLRIRSWNSQVRKVLKISVFLLMAFLAGFMVSVLLKGSLIYVFILLVRIFRIVNYLLAFIVFLNRVSSFETLKLVVNTFYIACVITAVVSALQGNGILPLFWPRYWLLNYGSSNWPTAFLSPHHLQIGVMMIALSGLSLYKFYVEKNILIKGLHPFITLVSLYVIFLNESRTAIFLSFFLLAIMVVKIRQFSGIFLLLIPIIIFSFLTFDEIFEEMNDRYEKVVVDQIEGKGSLSSTRTEIYLVDFPNIIKNHPWVLFIGAGFQNYISVATLSNAGHNNYIQYIVELGLFGFGVYIAFLISIYRCINFNSKLLAKIKSFDLKCLNNFLFAFFAMLLPAMFFNEILYPQYSQFTLPLQVLIILALPFIINKVVLKHLTALQEKRQ